jgi:hypothetical protein
MCRHSIDHEITDKIDQVIIEFDQAVANSKGDSEREQRLQNCFKILLSIQEKGYYYDAAQDLTPEEVEEERRLYHITQRETLKKKKLLGGEIVILSFDWDILDLTYSAGDYVICDTEWDPKTDTEMIAMQIQVYFRLSQSLIEDLKVNNFEIAFEDAVKTEEYRWEEEELTDEIREEVLAKKNKIIEYFSKSLALADSIGQNWLVFNGAIYVWNNYLPIFKNPLNDSKLLPDLEKRLLKEYFETMMKSIKDIEKKMIADYDLDTKIQVYGNIGIIYAR